MNEERKEMYKNFLLMIKMCYRQDYIPIDEIKAYVEYWDLHFFKKYSNDQIITGLKCSIEGNDKYPPTIPEIIKNTNTIYIMERMRAASEKSDLEFNKKINSNTPPEIGNVAEYLDSIVVKIREV